MVIRILSLDYFNFIGIIFFGSVGTYALAMITGLTFFREVRKAVLNKDLEQLINADVVVIDTPV